MLNNYRAGFIPKGVLSSLFILVGIAFVCILLAAILGQLITGGDYHTVGAMKLIQLLQSVGLFFIPPFLFAYFCSESVSSFLALSHRPPLVFFVLVGLFMLVCVPAINLTAFLNQRVVLPGFLHPLEQWMKMSEQQATAATEKMLGVHSFTALLFNVFLMALLPAIGEELFFRAALLRIFSKRFGIHWAVWITAIIFSAIHMQFYGFLPRMLLGAFFGYLLVWSKSLWVPVVAHFVNNALVVIVFYFRFNNYNLPDFDTLGTGTTCWMGCLSLALCAGMIPVFYRYLQGVEK